MTLFSTPARMGLTLLVSVILYSCGSSPDTGNSSSTGGTVSSGGTGISSSSAPAGDSYETDNSFAAAKTITVDAAAQTRSLTDAADVDWIKFTAAQTDLIYTIEATGSDILTMELFSSSNQSVAIDTGNTSSPIPFQPSATGTYYIKVSSFSSGSGAYTMKVVLETAPKSRLLKSLLK